MLYSLRISRPGEMDYRSKITCKNVPLQET